MPKHINILACRWRELMGRKASTFDDYFNALVSGCSDIANVLKSQSSQVRDAVRPVFNCDSPLMMSPVINLIRQHIQKCETKFTRSYFSVITENIDWWLIFFALFILRSHAVDALLFPQTSSSISSNLIISLIKITRALISDESLLSRSSNIQLYLTIQAQFIIDFINFVIPKIYHQDSMHSSLF